MTRTTLWRSLLVILLFAASGAFAQSDLVAIQELRNQWVTSFNSGDIAGVVAIYTEDTRTFLPTGEVYRGPDAVAAWLETWRSDMIESFGDVTFTVLPLRVDMSAHSAYEVGAFNLRAVDGTLVDHGDYITILVPTSQGWRIAYHMTTSTMLGEQIAQAMGDGM